MKFKIHRGTKEIGGSCVELSKGKSRIILDLGMPIVKPGGQEGEEFNFQDHKDTPGYKLVEVGILPDISGLYSWDTDNSLADGVLISHAHKDHYGFVQYIHPEVQIYASEGTAALLKVSELFLPDPVVIKSPKILPKSKAFQIGPFNITAFLVDHSAPDALAFEVETGGKKLFYSGDIRGHGRKGTLFERMIQNPPKHVTALLMEGSTIGRNKQKYRDENAVENGIAELIASRDNMALLFCSSQNLDRIVSAYKAAIRTDRILVIDLYTAFVLDALKIISSSIPQYYWDRVRVKFWHYHRECLINGGYENFVTAVAKSGNGIKMDELIAHRKNILMLAKANSLLPKILTRLPDFDSLTIIWSLWNGYLTGEDILSKLCAELALTIEQIHTSGHASIKDLKRLANAINPQFLIPIHTFYPYDYEQFGMPVRILEDGETMEL